jgi:2-(3-amino-3-carboxypropyl)histidine synthase
MRFLHIPSYSLSDPLPTLREHLRELEPYESIGLVATAQHLNRIDEVARFLKANGKNVSIGGQILGCRHDAALKLDVDCFLYIGSGRFHPLGLAMKTDKPVYILNPLSNILDKITHEEKKRWLGKRKGAISRAIESETFGIMVSTKDGQFSLKKALEMKKKLKERGKHAYIFAADELSPNNLLPFKVDCWVNTACPRIAGDEYNRPVVNPDELSELMAYI